MYHHLYDYHSDNRRLSLPGLPAYIGVITGRRNDETAIFAINRCRHTGLYLLKSGLRLLRTPTNGQQNPTNPDAKVKRFR